MNGDIPGCGYDIPDEDWCGWEDDDVGANLYMDDEYLDKRIEIAREKRVVRDHLEWIGE